MKIVKAYRKYGMMRVDLPEDPALIREFKAKVIVKRNVRVKVPRGWESTTEYEPCYNVHKGIDEKEFYTMGYGFRETVEKLCTAYGYTLHVEDVTPTKTADLLRQLPDLRVRDDVQWRENQKQVVGELLINEVGQFVLSTGGGKSFVIQKLFRLFPRARILVTTYSQRVLQQLHKDATFTEGINAGIYCASQKSKHGRVLFCSVGCLSHFIDEEWDILVLDEKHECATLERMSKLLRVKARRAYAFSANHNDRQDKADLWLTAAFGEPRVLSGYKEAVVEEDVVTVKVSWVDMEIPRFRSTSKPGTPWFMRKAYWANEARNREIAAVATERAAHGQTLIYVSKVEHIYRLQALLKCPVVHGGSASAAKRQELIDQGWVGEGQTVPTAAEMASTERDFAAGKLPLVICNSVWKRGLNMPHLKHLIVGDISGTAEDAVQVTGRVNRWAEGKTEGEIIDFRDQFDDTCTQRAGRRRTNYKKIGYAQEDYQPKKPLAATTSPG